MTLSSKPRRVRMVSVAVIAVGCIGFAWWSRHSRQTATVAHIQHAMLPGAQGRQYGWKQLEAILSPDGTQRTWETWSSKCNLADDIATARPDWRMNLTGGCASFRNLTIQNATLRAVLETAALTPQTAGDAFRPASVFFNDIAVKSINEGNWNLPANGVAASDPLIPGAALSPQVTFQPGSIIVKAIWEVVNSERSTWPLRVYDIEAPQWKQSAGITHPQSLARVEGTVPRTGWKTLVHLDINAETPCPYKDGTPPVNIPLDSTVPINCFTFHQITKDMYDVSMLGNTAGQQQEGYPFYLVLVGLNVSTRDDNGWKFTTFWWTNDPVNDPDHTSMAPADLSSKYTQFAMDTSEASSRVHNPYLEGPQGLTGMASDCDQCHRLAEVRVDPQTRRVIQTGSNFGLPDQIGNLPPGYDQHRILTDSVWTLADARDGGTILFSMSR